MSATVVFPLVMGQVCRGTLLARSPTLRRGGLGWVGQACLLLIIYTTFCDAFHNEGAGHHGLDAHAVFSVIVIGTIFIN